MKTKLIIFSAVLTLAFTGCNYANIEDINEQNTVKEEPANSMFVVIEETFYWDIVYQKDTKVMYAVSFGRYNNGTFTLLVNPDGTPMIYEGENNEKSNR